MKQKTNDTTVQQDTQKQRDEKPETHISKALAHLEKAKEQLRNEREKPEDEMIESRTWLQDVINDLGEQSRQLSGMKSHLERRREEDSQ